MRILVVDDERNLTRIEDAHLNLIPSDEITYARNLHDAGFQIFNFIWDEVYLDYDLGFNPETGRKEDGNELTNTLEEYAYDGKLVDVRKFIIHSANPVGREKMGAALRKFYNVEFARAEDLV